MGQITEKPTQVTKDDLNLVKENLFFIVGTSRSGTTLLQAMLSSHSQITLPPETHFFHELPRLQQRIGFKLTGDKIHKIIRFWQNSRTRMQDFEIPNSVIKDAVSLHSPTKLEDLFLLYLTIYGKQRGKKIIGEKTPRHIRHVHSILNTFPSAKVIALFRDPRAAALSEKKAQFGSPSVTVTSRRWKEYVKKHLDYEQRLPESQYKMLRYEDLIAHPQDNLKELSKFLGVSFEEDMLHYHKRPEQEQGFPSSEQWKAGTRAPIQKDRNERWKQELKDWEIQLIQKITGEYLEKLGYRPEEAPISKFLLNGYLAYDYARSVLATVSGNRKQGYLEPGKIRL